MNSKRCGLPDKETKFTKLVHNFSGGLVRKKRFELYSAKYEQRNLTWSVSEFSRKALRNQDEQVLEVFRKAFEVGCNDFVCVNSYFSVNLSLLKTFSFNQKLWEKETNLNFEFKPNTNTTDIVIGFYTKQHGSKFEPPFDGQNGNSF